MQVHGAIRCAAHEPVLTGGGQFEARKEPIGIGERAPGDERERSVQLLRERGQQFHNIGVDAHAVGGGRKLEQRAVDIQKYGGFGEQ